MAETTSPCITWPWIPSPWIGERSRNQKVRTARQPIDAMLRPGGFMILRFAAALTLASLAAFSQPAQLSGDWQTTTRRLGATQYLILNIVQRSEEHTSELQSL